VATELTLVSRAGRDAAKHALWLYRCACGRELKLRKDQAQRLQTCGACIPVSLSVSPVPATIQQPPAIPDAPPATVDDEPEAPRTPEVIVAEIATHRAALRRLEKDMVGYALLLEEFGCEPKGADGDSATARLKDTNSAAEIERKNVKRLEKELRDLSGQKAVALNATESVLARARRKLETKA